jgi:hypothetical protein
MFIFSAPKKSYILWTKGPDLSKNLNQYMVVVVSRKSPGVACPFNGGFSAEESQNHISTEIEKITNDWSL